VVTPPGPELTAMVAVTVFVEVLITETVLELKFVTYTLLPSGLTAMPGGSEPTAIVDITVLFVVLITDTVPEF